MSLRGLTPKERKKVALPKMTTEQAEILWNNMTYDQRVNFAKLYQKLTNGELRLVNVNVDDNEQIQNIVLAEKKQPSQSTESFAKHFKPDSAD
jgi:hypothetical protein